MRFEPVNFHLRMARQVLVSGLTLTLHCPAPPSPPRTTTSPSLLPSDSDRGGGHFLHLEIQIQIYRINGIDLFIVHEFQLLPLLIYTYINYGSLLIFCSHSELKEMWWLPACFVFSFQSSLQSRSSFISFTTDFLLSFSFSVRWIQVATCD